MSWFKVDDGFYSSRKVIRIPRGRRYSAIGLWLIAGTWCADHLTDGRIEAHELDELGGRVADARALVECQLWESVGDAYQFHNWEKYQPTRAQVLAQREAEAERKRRYRENKGNYDHRPDGVPEESQWDTNGSPDGQIPESGHPDPTRPDPTRPVPKGTSEGGAAKRGTRIDDPFIVTAEMREWAAERVPLVAVDRSTERFVNYWRSKSGKDATKIDWRRTWNNWLLSDQEKAEQRGTVRPTKTARAESVIEMGRRMEQQGERLAVSQ